MIARYRQALGDRDTVVSWALFVAIFVAAVAA